MQNSLRTLDRPDTKYSPGIDFRPDDTPFEMLGLSMDFPDNVIVIKVDDERYASTNFTVNHESGVEGITSQGLCCFADSEEANVFRTTNSIKGINGGIQHVSFEEARSIAKNKVPVLKALCMIRDLQVAEIHWVA